MSGHTPGPWMVEVDDQSGIGRSHAVYVCSAAGWPEGQLARINVQDGFGERESNARLIAAAPDLLAALEQIAVEAGIANKVIGMERDVTGSGRVKVATAMHRISELAFAAIAKATADPRAAAITEYQSKRTAIDAAREGE